MFMPFRKVLDMVEKKIKNMRKIILALAITLFNINTGFAQNNTNASFDGRKLIGKKWYYSDIFNGVRETRTMIFDKDSVKETIVRGNKTIIRHDAYYLDDYAAMEFWPLYVGKKSHGRFLFRGAKDGMVGVIIHKLTDDEFIYSFYRRSPLIKFTAMPLK